MVALIVGDLFTGLMFVIFLLWSQGIFKQTGVKTNKQTTIKTSTICSYESLNSQQALITFFMAIN